MQILEQLIHQIKTDPETVEFQDVIKLIDENYDYNPTSFINGQGVEQVSNQAGENEGSCKIFSFAKSHHLDQSQTLHCFGRYYRDDVLQHPENTDHENIRTFIKYGWNGITFERPALKLKEK